MLGSPIAQGRQAELYPWHGRTVIKLYRAGIDGHVAEATALASLHHTNIAPRLDDTVTINGRIGLVLERLDGDDMLTLLQHRPWRMPGMARTFAHAALRVHQTPAPTDLPNLIEVLDTQINAADLDTRRRDLALRTLKTLPAGDRLCHGDLHPGNAIVTKTGTRIIDWPAATRGQPSADLARTLLLLRQADPQPDTPRGARTLLAAGRSTFANIFAYTYRNATPHPPSNLDAWTLVNAAARLAEGIAAERAHLIKALDAASHESKIRMLP
jgi:serine/threonine protein kinase